MKKKNILSVLVVVILAGLAFYLNSQEGGTGKSLTNFSISDTASIDKLVLADNDGNYSKLTRQVDGTWLVNNDFKARQQNVQLILRGLKNFEVKSTVPKEAQGAIISQIAAKPIKLMVYQGGEKPSKIYYFGFATQDHYGNYALLEIPGEGKSNEAFIINEQGFHGFIRPRLITIPEEWRSPIVFDYPGLSIASITMEYPNFPEESFKIEWQGRNDIFLYDHHGNKIENFDRLKVKNYMLQYKAIYVETFDSKLEAHQEDSVIHQTIEKAHIKVLNKEGKTQVVKVYDKGYVDPFLRNEQYGEFDPERFYILYGEDDLALGQTIQWDPLLVPIKLFVNE